MTVAPPLTSPAPPRSLPRRYAQLLLGLLVCAVAISMTLQADLGVGPWDVFHGGLAESLGWSFGTVVIAAGLVVLGLGSLLGVRPGPGTLLNILVIGTGIDLLLATSWLDGLPGAGPAARLVVLVLGVALLGAGGALYIGAHLGAGPRDSVMVALHVRNGMPIGVARAAIEGTVLLAGMLLGGEAGIGTLVVALGSGPAVQTAFRLLHQTPAPRAAPARR